MMQERKLHIRQKFGRAAATYDGHAVVQLEVARQLASLLPCLEQIGSILEIGCGTGRFTHLIQQSYPLAQFTALDFAPEMVAKAQQQVAGQVDFICADGEEYLATCQHAFDLIASNATMQWFDDFEVSLGHVKRCLLPGGRALFSVFGPGSLHCLAIALDEVLGLETVLPSHAFADGDMVEDIATSLFSAVDVRRVVKQQRYTSFYELLVAIKTTGTGGYQQGLPRFTRRRLAELDGWFAKRGGVEVEYEIFLCHCKRGDTP